MQKNSNIQTQLRVWDKKGSGELQTTVTSMINTCGQGQAGSGNLQ